VVVIVIQYDRIDFPSQVPGIFTPQCNLKLATINDINICESFNSFNGKYYAPKSILITEPFELQNYIWI